MLEAATKQRAYQRTVSEAGVNLCAACRMLLIAALLCCCSAASFMRLRWVGFSTSGCWWQQQQQRTLCMGPCPWKRFLRMSRYVQRPPVSLKVAQFEAAQVGSNSRLWRGHQRSWFVWGEKQGGNLGPGSCTGQSCIELFAYRSIHTYYYHAPNYLTHACMMNCFGWRFYGGFTLWSHSLVAAARCS